MEDEIENENLPNTEDLNRAEMDEFGDLSELQRDQQDQQEEMLWNNQYPQPQEKDSIFSFFKRILGLKDSSKVANLDRKELGMLDLSVRNCQYLSQLGVLMGNNTYADFFKNKGEIILATSMSKKGWLPELVVSQKKYTQRSVQPSVSQTQNKGILGMGGGKSSEPAQQNG